ncbi:MAG: hypothetical protein ACPHLJ_07985 [Acidimicrobiales bacterium]
MAELAYFDADAHRNDIVNVLREDGACVLKHQRAGMTSRAG